MEDICNLNSISLQLLFSVDSDLNDFEKRLKINRNLEDQVHSSSDEEDNNGKPRFATEVDILKEKNRILMEKLFKS